MNKELDKQKIIKLYNKGESQADLARQFNVTRQCIHHIVNNYNSISEHLRRLVLKRDEYVCQWGETCKKLPFFNLHIHHIDSNPNNNSLDNLIVLCKDCHVKFHKTLNTEKWCKKHNLDRCKKCNSNKSKHRANGLCYKCSYKHYMDEFKSNRVRI